MTLSEYHKSQLLEALADAILVEDARGQIVYANRHAAALFGLPLEQLLGMPFERLISRQHRERWQRYRTVVDESTTAEPIRLSALRRDAEEIPIEIRCGLLEGDRDRLLVGSIRRVGTMLSADEAAALQRERDRAQRYLDIAAVILVAIDAERRVTLINRKGLEILGYTREAEVIGKDWFAHFLPPTQREAVAAVFERLIRGELEPVEYYENPIVCSDGTERLILWHNSLLQDTTGQITGILSSGQDITESKLADARLRAQSRLNRAITECAAESIFLTDATGRITMVNPEAERLFGYTQEEFNGQMLHELLHYQYPDGRPYPNEECANCRIYSGGEKVHHHEVVFFCKEGREVTVVCSNAPLEIDGEVTGAVLVAHDISERKVFEEALQEADRRKDEFLAMLAHELRNPLAPILNAAQILGLFSRDEERILWAQEIIERQVSHLSRLVDELLDVSRIARGKIRLKRAPVLLEEVIAQATESVRPIMDARGQRLVLRLPAEPIRLEADLLRLVQTLLNVLDNAAKYSPAGARIELEAQAQGREAIIRVRDPGEGISAELLPHVFDLFRQGERSQDKDPGGLGLGLTLVKRLIELHGGSVEVDSAGPRQGTTLTLHLPLQSGQPGAQQGAADETTIPRGLHILVVDDDREVADSTALILEAMGHQASVAYSGHEAIEQMREAAPQVVLLDLGLQGMDGFRIATALRQQPGGEALRLVAITGYGDSRTRNLSQVAGFDDFLVKPISPKQLSDLLATVKQ
jgi:PAS domain S-box-containing protein